MIEIIPAIDIIDGKCVRLSQGNYDAKSVYSESPLEMAKKLEDIGIRRLHMVDLDGAKNGRIANLHVLETVAKDTSLMIDFGGGIRTDTDVDSVLNAGAFKISVSSIVIKEPVTFVSWIEKYGSDSIMLGADVKDELIRIDGWKGNTNLNVFDFITANFSLGIHHFFCTDINKDGLLNGPSYDLYQRIRTAFPKIHLVASGGVSKMEDIYQLESVGCDSVIIGKALYEGKIKPDDLQKYISSYEFS